LSSNTIGSITKYYYPKTKKGKKSKQKRKIKSRSGNVQTIGIFEAYDLLINEYSEPLSEQIRNNLEGLVEIRDSSVHFVNKGLDIERKILEIGTASLNNYIKISRQWFGSDLSKYNIFLMPIAFIREIPKAEGLILNGEEKNIAQYFEELSKKPVTSDNREFNTSLSVEISLKRSKEKTAIKFSLSNDPDAVAVKLEEADIREKYPWSYDLLTIKLKAKMGTAFKANQKYHRIRRNLEENEKYCITRHLDPGNPKSSNKKFYNPNILKEIERLYNS